MEECEFFHLQVKSKQVFSPVSKDFRLFVEIYQHFRFRQDILFSSTVVHLFAAKSELSDFQILKKITNALIC